jgi:DNA-binding NarL/FixJ family response regulator
MPAAILIVEDHGAVRGVLRHQMEAEFPQYHVIEAASGEEAIALIRIESPRVVVMDINLPGMNGIEATRQIKAIVPSVPIVVWGFHDDDIYRAHALASGASAYLPQPAMLTKLLPTLAALLANGASEGQEVRHGAHNPTTATRSD